MNHRVRTLLALAAAVVGLAGCERTKQSQPSADDERFTIAAVNYPLAYFATRLAGPDADVYFPAPNDVDPAFWRPTSDEIAQYQQADLILLNGAGYARWTAGAVLPASRLVKTGSSFADRLIEQVGATHSHGLSGEHSHADTAFTTWLDPTLAIRQADAVRQALGTAVPEQRTDVDARFTQLKEELQALDERLAAAARSDVPLLASHPVYQYLAARYNLDVQSLHWEPEQMPDESEWEQLAKRLESHDASWILWEDTPIEPIASRLRRLGVESIVFNPCGNVPEEGDYLTTMRANAERFEQVFRTPDDGA